jgi:hypothetical protein
MLLSCLKRVAGQAQEDGRIEMRLVRPALVDPDVMMLLANDLIEVEGVEHGPEGMIVYRLTERARMLAQARPLLPSRAMGPMAGRPKPRVQEPRRTYQ